MDEAYDLFENTTLNHYQWSTDRRTQKKIVGKYDVDAIDHLAAKMNILTQRIDKMSMNALSTAPSNSCEIYGYMGHTTMECQSGNFNSQDP